MRQFIRCFAVYLAAAAVASGLAAVSLRLWLADLDVPLSAGSDNWMNLAWTKGVAETGWYLHNDRLGAPHEMDLRDYPMTDVWHFLCLKGLVLLGCSAAKAINLYFLAGFPLAAVSALAVLRRWGVALGPAFVVAQLYAFMPFHFTPGQDHLFLSAYYLLPPMIGMALSVWRDGGPRSRCGWVGWGALSVLAGGSGVYYVFYVCFFLLVAAAACALRLRRARPLAGAAVPIVLMTASVVACGSPSVSYHRQYLDNPLVGQRYALESMRYSLQFARLFAPVKDHYLEPLADCRRRIDVAMLPYPTESDRCSLGVVGCVGLVYLLGRLLAPRRGEGEPAPLTDDGLKLFTVTGLLLTVTGGGAVLFAMLVSPAIRAHARITALLAFFALMAVGLLLTRLSQRLHGRTARTAFGVCLAGLLAAGFLDQTGWGIVPDHQAHAEQWRHDQEFVAQIEESLPPDSSVFCLPVLSFPEGMTAGGMRCCYEQLRGYVHSRRLRWSYGAIRNRYAGVWHERLRDAEVMEMLDVLALSDFAGVLIDRHGLSREQEEELSCLLGVEPLQSSNGRLAFYPLAGWHDRLRERLSPDAWLEARLLASRPILTTLHGELSGDEGGSLWIGHEACFTIHNPTGEPRRVTLTMPFERAEPGRRSPRLRVAGDGWQLEEKVPLEGWRLEREIELAPGENRVWVRASGPERDRLLCPRRAVVRVVGFLVKQTDGGPPADGPPDPAPQGRVISRR